MQDRQIDNWFDTRQAQGSRVANPVRGSPSPTTTMPLSGETGASTTQALLEALECVLWTRPASGVRVRLYGAVEHLTGYPPQAFEAQPTLWTDLVHPEDRHLLESDRRSACEEKECIWSWRLVRADGQVVRVRELSSVHRDPETREAVQRGLIFSQRSRSRDSGTRTGPAQRMLMSMLQASGFPSVAASASDSGYFEDARQATAQSVWTAEQYSLIENGELLRMLFDRVPTGIVVLVGDTLLANGAVERMTGYRVDEVSTMDRWFELLFPGRSVQVRAMHDEDWAAGYPTRRLLSVTHRNGDSRHIEFDGSRVGNANVWFMNDLTERVRNERQMAENSAQVRAMLQAIPDLILVLDELGTAVQVQLTEQHRRLFAVEDDALVGQSVLNLFSVERGQRGREIIRNVIRSGEMAFVEFSLDAPNRSCMQFEARISRLNAETALAIVRDVTEQYHTREQLNRLAFEDALTGLPNRRRFTLELQQAMEASANDDFVTVLFVDLDRFKSVNDSYGHSCGDDVLVAIAQRLRRVIDPQDVPARYAGDEFLVLLQHESSVMNARALAHRVLEAVAQPVHWNGNLVYVTASVGVVNYRVGLGAAAECLAEADAAMYRAKAVGRNTVVVFNSDMRQDVARGLRLEVELRNAIQNDEIRLFYQPVCDAQTGEIVSFEALARWQHPVDGLRSADYFIPMAEERGIIVPLGYRLIQIACNDIAGNVRSASSLRQIPIQVNISYQQLAMPGFVGQVRELIRHYEIPAGLLRFEMTETALIADARLAQLMLDQLLELGISTVIDDFGVGYSSLSYLLQYPLKGMKVDRSFVMKITEDPKASLILQTIRQLGQGLGLPVVAEGVETPEQLQRLVSLGYQHVQGFLFSEAVPWSEIVRKYTDDPRIVPRSSS